MINKKEAFTIFGVILILSFSLSLLKDLDTLWAILASITIVVCANIFIKKLFAHHLDAEIEIKLWRIKQFGFKPEQRFKHPFPAGAFIPILSKILFFPFKTFIWMASLVFDIKPKIYKAAKRHGLYTFSDMTEEQVGLIAAAGIAFNLILSVLGYFLGFHTFAQLNIYYAFFNMLPISNLDGNKIFFGNLVLWSCLACITLVGFLLSILII